MKTQMSTYKELFNKMLLLCSVRIRKHEESRKLCSVYVGNVIASDVLIHKRIHGKI
jgi:hypothetical protein